MAPEPDPELEGEAVRLLIAGIGAGAKGVVTGYVSKVLPGVSEDIAAIGAGAVLWYFGGRWHWAIRAFGAGMLIAGIGQMTKGLTAGFAPGGGGAGETKTTQAQGDVLAALAQAQAGVPAIQS